MVRHLAAVVLAASVAVLPNIAVADADRVAYTGPDCGFGNVSTPISMIGVGETATCRAVVHLRGEHASVVTSDGPVFLALRPAVKPSDIIPQEGDAVMPAVLADLDQEHDRLQVRPSVDGRRVSHMVLETSDGRLPIVFVADDGRMPDTRVIVRTLETRK